MRLKRFLPRSLVLLLAGATAGPVTAAGVKDVVGVRLAANEASARSQQKIDVLADATDKLAAEYRSTLQQIESLRVYNEQLGKLVTAQEEEAASLADQIEQVALIGREVTPLMLEMIDALEAFVALDVPFLGEERRMRVEALRELMNRADVTDSERYRRVLEAYQIENDYGRTIEAYQGTLVVAGDTRTVDFLRVGRIALLYQTLDGEHSGAWDKQKGDWVELDSSYRVSLRQGLRIARKQTAPDLLRLPIPAAVEEGR